MKCPECGKQESDGFLFCTACSAMLTSAFGVEELHDKAPQSSQPSGDDDITTLVKSAEQGHYAAQKNLKKLSIDY